MLIAEVDITVVPTEEGGRQEPIFPRSGVYMPHFRVRGKGEWLGVRFFDGPKKVAPGDSTRIIVELMYHPRVDYSTVKPGVPVDVVEGSSIIAHGRVVRVWETSDS